MHLYLISIKSPMELLLVSILKIYYIVKLSKVVATPFNTGNFSNTFVNLYGNNIATFSSGVFKSMLTDMTSGTGYLEIFGSKSFSEHLNDDFSSFIT